MKTILIIDGQGGMLGKQMVEAVKRLQADGEIIAVGTNSIATANMLVLTEEQPGKMLLS